MMTYISIVAGILLILAMAKKGRKSFRNYIRGSIDIDQSLSTLAADTGVLAATQTVTERTRVSSVKNTYSISDETPAANQGPIIVGVAHSDYSLAEIEAWLESTTSWDASNLVEAEVQGRKIRQIGVYDVPVAVGGSYALNDGKPITTKLNWILTTGQGLNFWFYNSGTVDIGSSAPNGKVVGHANLWTL